MKSMNYGWTTGSVSMVRMVSMMRVTRLIAGVRDSEERAMSIMEVMDVSIRHTMLYDLSTTGQK